MAKWTNLTSLFGCFAIWPFGHYSYVGVVAKWTNFTSMFCCFAIWPFGHYSYVGVMAKWTNFTPTFGNVGVVGRIRKKYFYLNASFSESIIFLFHWMPPLFQNLKNLISTEGRIGVQWERPNLDLDFSKDSAFRGPPYRQKQLDRRLTLRHFQV